MKGNKIFKKLFLMTLGFGCAILLLQFVFQYFWLDDFYYYSKEKNIETQLEQLETRIMDPTVSYEAIDTFIREIGDKSNTATTVFSGTGEVVYGDFFWGNYYLTLMTKENEAYQIYLDDYWNQEEFLLSLKKDMEIKVKGYLVDNASNEFYPDSIIVNDVEYKVKTDTYDLDDENIIIEESLDSLTDENKITISADEVDPEKGIMGITIVDTTNMVLEDGFYTLDVPSEVEGTILYSSVPKTFKEGKEYTVNQLFNEQMRFYYDDKEALTKLHKKGYVSYRRADEYTGIENLISVKVIKDLYGEQLYAFSILSLQSVKQSTDIMQSYFYLTVIAAFILAIIFSYIYSKKMTKPLLHLNEVTERLANIDFTARCVVKSDDEIGELADNINTMSDRLESTLKQLKQFLADASHELKTPLTVMKGILEGMMDGVYDVKNPEHFKRMQGEINDMSQLVYDLLELSKLESGEVNFKEEVFQLSDVILKTHDKVALLVSEKELSVKVEVDDQFVLGNEKYIETVVRNFYTNAIQYTRAGGEISIAMTEEDERCLFVIENTPSHIGEEALEKLWQPFFRVEQSRNKALGGTGLGLYMIKEILDKHNSAYKIENTEQGVRATFDLLMVREEEIEL